jgi:Protein of unknown function (DUF2474)
MAGVAPRPGLRGWMKRLGWLAALWVGGVVLMGVAAYALKLLMRAVGMSS